MPLPEITHIASLIESDKAEEARALLQDVLSVVPSHLSATVLMAKAFDSSADFKSAFIFWKKAVLLCPGNPVIERGLRRSLARNLFSDAKAEGNEPEESLSPYAPLRVQEGPIAPSSKAPLPAGSPVAPSSKAPLPGNAPVPPPTSQPASTPAIPTTQMSVEPSPPTTQLAAEPSSVEYQDLDKLINELETARIIPDPDIQLIPQGELETEIDDVVSETLARIYANQKFFAEAAAVYEKLAVQRPEKAAEFAEKANEMRAKSSAKS